MNVLDHVLLGVRDLEALGVATARGGIVLR
jgi:hypothetical protein